MQTNTSSDPRYPDSENVKTEIERDLAELTAVKLARENDTLAQENDTLAQQRDVATTIAGIESQQRLSTEQEALSARMGERRAQHEANRLATEHSVLRENLASEREAASNASFGFVFLACIVLAALIGLGIWAYTSNSTPTTASNGVSTNVVTPANSVSSTDKPVTVKVQPPTVIYETPPPVIVKPNPPTIVVPPPVQKGTVDPAPATPESGTTDDSTDTSDKTKTGENSNEGTTPPPTTPDE